MYVFMNCVMSNYNPTTSTTDGNTKVIPSVGAWLSQQVCPSVYLCDRCLTYFTVLSWDHNGDCTWKTLWISAILTGVTELERISCEDTVADVTKTAVNLGEIFVSGKNISFCQQFERHEKGETVWNCGDSVSLSASCISLSTCKSSRLWNLSYTNNSGLLLPSHFLLSFSLTCYTTHTSYRSIYFVFVTLFYVSGWLVTGSMPR